MIDIKETIRESYKKIKDGLLSANPEPSSLNSFIADMNNRYLQFVGEKVQRPGVEDNEANKTPVELIGMEVFHV